MGAFGNGSISMDDLSVVTLLGHIYVQGRTLCIELTHWYILCMLIEEEGDVTRVLWCAGVNRKL